MLAQSAVKGEPGILDLTLSMLVLDVAVGPWARIVLSRHSSCQRLRVAE